MPLTDEQDQALTIGGVAAGGGGLAANHAVKSGLLTGRTTLYHGTRKDLHQGILEKGLRPASEGQRGITEILGDRVPGAKDHVYTTGKKQVARGYAVQADSIKKVIENPELVKNPGALQVGLMRAQQAPGMAEKVMNPLNNGGILEANVPLWKSEYADKLIQNPEARKDLAEFRKGQGILGAMKPDLLLKAERNNFLENKVFKGGLGPEVFKKSPRYQRNSLKEIGQYIKARPGRFAGGALLAAGGIGAMGYGADRIHKAFHPEEQKTAACVEELAKIGAITDDQAHAALSRYETLERNKPTMDQVGRYAGLGAAAGVGVGALGNAIKGGRTGGVGRIGHLLGARIPGAGAALRAGTALAATGAIGSGAIPLIRGHLDRQAEKKTLKTYLAEKTAAATGVTPARRFSPDIPVMLALGSGDGLEDDEADYAPTKRAFATSAYDGGLAYPTAPQRSGLPPLRALPLHALVEKKAAGAPTAGGFLMASEMPAYRHPSLQRVAQGQPQAIVTKLAGVPTTPGGLLSRAKAVGAPKLTSFGAGSINTIAKPHGFGKPLAGTLNNRI